MGICNWLEQEYNAAESKLYQILNDSHISLILGAVIGGVIGVRATSSTWPVNFASSSLPSIPLLNELFVLSGMMVNALFEGILLYIILLMGIYIGLILPGKKLRRNIAVKRAPPRQ